MREADLGDRLVQMEDSNAEDSIWIFFSSPRSGPGSGGAAVVVAAAAV
jgi:hypothetical protein